ncbi:unnamed protein product [Trichogramma brassicae]|uniref:Uncharacterized protein n=1 Tax=Trichogramma brassicae TaxID=86971 RepID=A0A6H5I6E2_9HYME|nr:unnamed protein product [Trichogramma brassicae]
MRMENLSGIRDKATENSQQAQERQAQYYNKKRRDVTFKANDKVWRRNRILSSGAKGIAAKLGRRFRGPCKVSKVLGSNVYQLIGESGELVEKVTASDLKPCYSRSSTAESDERNSATANVTSVKSTTAAVSDERKSAATDVTSGELSATSNKNDGKIATKAKESDKSNRLSCAQARAPPAASIYIFYFSRGEFNLIPQASPWSWRGASTMDYLCISCPVDDATRPPPLPRALAWKRMRELGCTCIRGCSSLYKLSQTAAFEGGPRSESRVSPESSLYKSLRCMVKYSRPWYENLLCTCCCCHCARTRSFVNELVTANKNPSVVRAGLRRRRRRRRRRNSTSCRNLYIGTRKVKGEQVWRASTKGKIKHGFQLSDKAANGLDAQCGPYDSFYAEDNSFR